ncbi:MAG TPA: 2-oxoacid:ferredoxin oxidoreductase subunit beta [Bdellovibrionota bacterium]|nr:2-oxoacid:ferredoxin oxidoreductase subunit beta [Bdellovibrionota bacterium]
MTEEKTSLSRQDFLSPIDPRWCPGCGCYSVLKGLTTVFAKLGIPKEKFAVISGIGCSSRFPYYTDTYGFHTLHGRAPTIATGIKLVKPDISTWIITGDGDALSIGGNHFMHLMRRNPDIKVIIFNNQIYGLTKGQASPTTQRGFRTKSTPWGSIERPVQPISLAIAAGATFVARVSDREGPRLVEVLEEAAKHRGSALVEVLINCVIFNDGAYEYVTERETKPERTIWLKHGEPILFGAKQEKGLIFKDAKLEAVDLEKDKIDKSNVLVHNVYSSNPGLAYQLSLLQFPRDPFPYGIFRQVSEPTFEELVAKQHSEVEAKIGKGNLKSFLHSSETWEVK